MCFTFVALLLGFGFPSLNRASAGDRCNPGGLVPKFQGLKERSTEDPLDLTAFVQKYRSDYGRPGQSALPPVKKDVAALFTLLEDLEATPVRLKGVPKRARPVKPMGVRPPQAEIDETLAEFKKIDRLFRGPLRDLDKNKTLSAAQRGLVDKTKQHAQLALVEKMSQYLQMIGVPHKIGQSPAVGSGPGSILSAPAIILAPGDYSKLGKLVETIVPERGSGLEPRIRTKKMLWVASLEFRAVFLSDPQMIVVDTDSVLTQTVSPTLRHELDHGFEGTLLSEGTPSPYQVSAIVVKKKGVLPGRGNTDRFYGDYVSFEELKTYDRDLTHHLLKLQSYLRKNTGPVDREKLLELFKEFVGEQHQMSALVERELAVLDVSIQSIRDGKSSYTFFEPNSLEVQVDGGEWVVTIDNLRPEEVRELRPLLESRTQAAKSTLKELFDTIALKRLRETRLIAADQEVIAGFQDGLIDTLLKAKSLGEQIDILEAILGARQARPLPGSPDYVPLTAEKLRQDYLRAMGRGAP